MGDAPERGSPNGLATATATLGTSHKAVAVSRGHTAPRRIRHATAAATIGPAESFRFRIKADHPGTWFYHCHVEAHMAAGMQGFFEVSGRARRAL